MSAPSPSEITLLLRAWSNGDPGAVERLTPLIYGELHKTARRYMAREKPGHLLQTTGLVNETYLRLASLKKTNWQDRGHFFAVCARLMRHILTEFARARPRLQGGKEAQYLPLEQASSVPLRMSMDLASLEDALNVLTALDERQGQVVRLRYFMGLTVKETAKVLKVSERTVKHDWLFAKMWLLRELSRGKENGK
jgi:RNA polymerase sigma factor (TIGR02999 family)